MESNVRYVGLDYHSRMVQVCVLDSGGKVLKNRPCPNRWEAIHQFVGEGTAVHAAIESCTGAANLADELVNRAGWSVDLAHPGYVRRIKQNPDKTDFSDARLLADLERVGYVPRVWQAPEPIQELRRLVGHREQLAHERKALKQRIGAPLRDQRVQEPPVGRWTRAWVDWLRGCKELSEQTRWIQRWQLRRLAQVVEELRALERHLEKLTADDPLVARLISLKGIGLVTACTLRARVGRFDRFTSGKQLARFCGLSPRNASSGERQAQAGLIHTCDRRLRAIIMEAAHRLVRFDARWRALAEQLQGRGKRKCVAIAAVANRWMRWLYHQMKPLGLAC